MTSVAETIYIVPILAVIIFLTRLFPFALFSKRNPPAFIRFIERFIPPMVMAVLVVYCLKDIQWSVWPSGIRELAAIVVVTALHIWKKNAMLSIFGGTAVYMLLVALS